MEDAFISSTGNKVGPESQIASLYGRTKASI
jgi:hypothetical protein